MPRPLPFDHYGSTTDAASTHAPSASSSHLPAAPSSAIGQTEIAPSPFYGLEPEAVASILIRPTALMPLADQTPGRDGDFTGTLDALSRWNDIVPSSLRRYSGSSIDPVRPTSRIRTPSPPPHPFDGEQGSTSAWLRWLGERRARRIEADGGDPVRAAQSPNDPLRRLRQSAERLRTVESRIGGSRLSPTSSAATTTNVSHQSEAVEAYEESRRLLSEVRARLNETRTRIEDVRVLAETEDPEDDDREVNSDRRESVRLARQGLSRTVAFATRLGQLASTLTDLSDRASALTDSGTSARTASSPYPRPSSASPVTLPISSSPLESSASAQQTDSIRHTVRQLIVASRRVSAAIDRHRAQQDMTPATPPDSSDDLPLPPTDLPLRVTFPSATQTTDPDQPSVFANGTSPNLDGLLLPSRPFTHSPLAISADRWPPPQEREPGENYPGERAQLVRIANLQRDIASRAVELRELRARGRELDREERESRRSRLNQDIRAGSTHPDAEKEDDDDDQTWIIRALGRQVEVEGSSSGDETVMQPRRKTKEERQRHYKMYSFCGR
ncbi:uncharacterized protein JCM15063_005554 [Sporobolomyces koalae]|uniref:uncharacterized protein n=1 Tax=Sporobolomyces koalae TaxID=500713 RepID=UPI003174F71E